MNTSGIILLIILLFVLYGTYFLYERSGTGLKIIAFTATMSGFAAAMRSIFTITLPSLQPATFLITLTGYVFGPFQGIVTGATTAFVSNAMIGQIGPYTPWQMFGWGLAGFIGGMFKYIIKNKNMGKTPFSVVCAVNSALFSIIMNAYFIIFMSGNLRQSKNIIFATFINSFTFDMIHIIGSVAFTFVFYDKLYNVMKRYYLRLRINE